MALSKQEIKKLKGLAHHLKAIINIGKEGLSEPLVKTVEEALNSRELIKVKFLENSALNPKDDGKKLAQLTEAEFVGAIGFIAILYKYSENAKNHILDENF